jgi:hypothetical protein
MVSKKVINSKIKSQIFGKLLFSKKNYMVQKIALENITKICHLPN